MLNINNSLVSIIVRTTPFQSFSLFRDCINSIINNTYRPIEIVIIVQSNSITYFEKIKEYLSTTMISQNDLSFQVLHNQTNSDQRAKNLNIGLQNSQGTYIGFLDDDDILYKNHIQVLVNSLKTSNYIWAYSDVTLSINQVNNLEKITPILKKPFIKFGHFNIKKLLRDNFIPIHSYIINTSKISKENLFFDESFTIFEDYVFLLNLAYIANPLYIPVQTCEYRMFTDGKNTNYYINQYLGLEYRDKIKQWNKARLRVEKVKKELFPEYHSHVYFIRNIRNLLTVLPFIYGVKQFVRSILKKKYI